MDSTVGAYEAKTQLSSLLERVAQGEEFTITKHGVPVARLIPVGGGRSEADIQAAIEAIRELRKGNRLDGLKIRDMIEEGRR
jgi:prevent-host-death family protein